MPLPENFTLESKLLGERIELRRLDLSMAESIFAIIHSERERLSEFLPWPPSMETLEDEVNYILRTSVCWDHQSQFDFGIYMQGGKDYMGNIGAFNIAEDHGRCEIGYWIAAQHEGQGFMREAVATLEKELFRVGFHRIEIRCEPANQRSASIPEKLGYQLDGILRQELFHQGRYIDSKVYSKLAVD
jgi:RimJ/RimL family protein N-acetyltransferase